MPKDDWFYARRSKAAKYIFSENSGAIWNRTDLGFAYRNRRSFYGLLRKGTLVTIRLDDGKMFDMTFDLTSGYRSNGRSGKMATTYAFALQLQLMGKSLICSSRAIRSFTPNFQR
jgi:hypothetical protein